MLALAARMPGSSGVGAIGRDAAVIDAMARFGRPAHRPAEAARCDMDRDFDRSVYEVLVGLRAAGSARGLQSAVCTRCCCRRGCTICTSTLRTARTSRGMAHRRGTSAGSRTWRGPTSARRRGGRLQRQALNIAQGRAYSLLDVKRELEEVCSRQLVLERRPPRTGDVTHTLADVTRARHELDCRPSMDFRGQLERTASWFRDSHPRGGHAPR